MHKILIVDDEPDVLNMLKRRFESTKQFSVDFASNGYEVITAMDGMQATNMAIKEQPDVIVLDIGMPAGSGHVVAKRLQNSVKTCSIPIIYLTARTSLKDYKEATDLGVSKYITKPFDPEELLMAISESVVKA